MTVHGKTYFNAYPLNGQNRFPSVSCPLESSFKSVRGVNKTVSFKRLALERKVYPLAEVLYPLAVRIRALERTA